MVSLRRCLLDLSVLSKGVLCEIMVLSVLAVVFGLALLVWSADRFVEGAASSAKKSGMSPMLIGMVIMGFGTSAPEMVVSVLSAFQGNPGIALGNAYGSNIANIAVILGVTAVISPIAVSGGVLRKELPVLSVVTLLAAFQLYDGRLSRLDGMVLLLLFAVILIWGVVNGRDNNIKSENESLSKASDRSNRRDAFDLLAGLIVLVISSKLMVWGAVGIAHRMGVSDLIIGLTVVALGTSLPELASSIMACRRGEHEMALGNVLGSNLFNTLAVVGLAGAICPMDVPPEVLSRDMAVMGALTLSLFVICYGFRGKGRINRFEGAGLLAASMMYSGWLLSSSLGM